MQHSDSINHLTSRNVCKDVCNWRDVAKSKDISNYRDVRTKNVGNIHKLVGKSNLISMRVSTTGTSKQATKRRLKKLLHILWKHGNELHIVGGHLWYYPPTRSHQNCIILHTARISVKEAWHGQINPILHTWFRDSCFTCDGSPAIQIFPMIFHIGMVI